MNRRITQFFSVFVFLVFSGLLGPLYAQKKQVYAVVVGVNIYESCDASGSSNLNYCVKDARSFAELLRSTGVPSSNISLLTDEKATSSNIKRAIRSMFSKATLNDRVIFFFSGHGMNDYFITYDCMTSLSHSDLKAGFKASGAGTKLCFADACHSGSIKSLGKTGQQVPLTEQEVESRFKTLKQDEAKVAVFISSRSNQVSLEAPWLGNGAFTHFLLRGLRGEADDNSDRLVTISELYSYVQLNVKRETNNTQIPVLFGKFDLNMPLLRLKK